MDSPWDLRITVLGLVPPGMEYQWFSERYQHFMGSVRRLAERMDQLEGLVKKIAGPGGNTAKSHLIGYSQSRLILNPRQ